MPPRISWRELVPGIIALSVIVAFMVLVMTYAGVGRIRGDTRRIHVVAAHARGVMEGTEVWIAGKQAGEVSAIAFRAPSGDTAGSVVLELRVLERHADLVRRDSRIQIRAGANFMGPIVVYVEPGTPGSPAAAPGDTLYATSQSSLAEAGERLGPALREFGPALANARVVIATVREGRGSIGALLDDSRPLRAPTQQLASRMAALSSTAWRAGAGSGAADLRARTRSAFAQLDTLRQLLASPAGSAGRFRRDTSLFRALAELRAEFDAIAARLDSDEGVFARMPRDSAVSQSLTAARAELALLIADARRHPLRYLHF